MDLSIIIVNWNTRKLLLDCLLSIYRDPPACSFETWVVDNGSKDGSCAAIKEDFPQVKLIENQENVGFAPANNQAIAQSQGRYVLLLNSDTIVLPSALQCLVEFMDKTPDAGAAGPRLLNPDRSLQISCFPTPTLQREMWRLLHLDRLKACGVYPAIWWQKHEIRRVDAVQGACLILRQAALKHTGSLDPEYFMYTEEIDLCFRLKKAGWNLYWVPRAEVIHYGGQSTQQIAPQMFLSLYQTKTLFFRKNYGMSAARVYKAILFTASIIRLVLHPAALLLRPRAQHPQLNYLAKRYLDLIAHLPVM